MNIPLPVVFCGAGAALILFVANIVMIVKTGSDRKDLAVACHVLGIITGLINLLRIAGVEFGPVIVANVVALICILASLRRVLKGAPAESAEPTEPTV